jgi:hypothetical protein
MLSADMAKVEARRPHAARQTFFAALEFSLGLKIFVKCTRKNAIFEENVDFLSHKMTFLKKIYGTSCDFHIAEKFSKNFEPLYPWNKLADPRTLQIIEKN